MATGTTPEKFDPKFTQHVIDTMGPKTSPRTREIFGSLIKHLHDFAREVELTTDEWLEGVKFVNSIGQISTKQRNEAHRMSDILGLESYGLNLLQKRRRMLLTCSRLVVEINNHHAVQSDNLPTSSAILGPFWSPNAPFRENGDSIIMSPHEGQISIMHGQVTDVVTQKPIANAVVDIWQASSNGKYDFQDPDNQVDNNLRGKFRTDENGYYHYYCLRPTAYSLPTDGPAGQIFKILDRHPMRPAHIHLMVSTLDN